MRCDGLDRHLLGTGRQLHPRARRLLGQGSDLAEGIHRKEVMASR